MGLTIRPARKGDAAGVLALVKALAAYEKRGHEVVAGEDALDRALFAESPRVFCDLADWDGEVAGFALCYSTFSTFSGRHGFYLEDLFVHPHLRGRGIGKGLLAHLARRCLAEGGERLSWSVLTWNAPAIRFYEQLGAKRIEDWFGMKIRGQELERLAAPRTSDTWTDVL